MSHTEFIVHDETGKIVWTGSCHADHVVNQPLEPGQKILIVPAPIDQRRHKVVAGELVEKELDPPQPLPPDLNARIAALEELVQKLTKA